MDWKQEFLQLYTSDDINNLRKALNLKQEHIPPKIYRYRSVTDDNMVHRFGEINSGILYLSHPEELNDPFEVRSVLHSRKAGDFLCAKEHFQNRFVDSMPKEQFARIFEKDDFLEDLAEYVARKTSPPDYVAETKEILLKVYMEEVERFNAHIDDTFRKMIRFACFTTKPDNLPMWHHYANGHTGICLEFDTTKIINIYHINMLFPVNYVTQLPDMAHMMAQRTNPKYSSPEYQAIHKLKDWDYEDEWRLIQDVASFYGSPEEVPPECWTRGISIEFTKPSRVVLGMKIEPAHEDKIRRFCQLEDIPVVKAERTEYGLKVD